MAERPRNRPERTLSAVPAARASRPDLELEVGEADLDLPTPLERADIALELAKLNRRLDRLDAVLGSDPGESTDSPGSGLMRQVALLRRAVEGRSQGTGAAIALGGGSAATVLGLVKLLEFLRGLLAP
jgi:hypothetical protein